MLFVFFLIRNNKPLKGKLSHAHWNFSAPFQYKISLFYWMGLREDHCGSEVFGWVDEGAEFLSGGF